MEYDWSPPGTPPGDGVVDLPELNLAACSQGGFNTTMDVCNGVLVDKELANITSVTIVFKISNEGTSSDYFAEAQLRNRR